MNRAQSSLEYAAVILCVIVALLAMRAYISRGMQGRVRQIADELGQPYDPRNTTSDITTAQGGQIITTTNTHTVTNAQTNRETSETRVTTNVLWESEWRYGNETVGNLP